MLLMIPACEPFWFKCVVLGGWLNNHYLNHHYFKLFYLPSVFSPHVLPLTQFSLVLIVYCSQVC